MLRILIFVFFISVSNWTLFNPVGIFPLSLIVAIFIMLTLLLQASASLKLRFRISIEDLFIFIFLLVSVSSVFLSSIDHQYNLNLNHLYAEISVIVLYYFFIKLALNYCEANMVLKAIYVASLIIAITGIIDYVLLIQGINIADILPMEQTNLIAGSGFSSRVRGFYVEPTDFAMALNAFFPISILYAFSIRRTKRMMLLIFLYSFCLVVSRSAAAFGGLLLGFSMAFFVAIIKRDISIKNSIKYLIVPTVFLTLFLTLINIYYFNFFASILQKLSLSNENISVVNRLAAYLEMIELFMLPEANIYLGYGTGFLSGDFGRSGHNWYLSILVEKGIVGFLVISLLLLTVFIRLIRQKSIMMYGFMVSFVAIAVHYATQTGFYFPFFWILIVIIQLRWTNHHNTNDISNSVEFNVPKAGV
jgi:hypothetical protein